MILDPFILTIKDLYKNEHKVSCLGYQHTIEYVKFMLSEITGINREQIILIMGSTKLLNYMKLEDYSINESSSIFMTISMKTGVKEIF